MPISPGDKLGPYEILAPLGAGEMVKAYRFAQDGSLMFHDEGTSYRKPSDWIAMKRLSDKRYVLDKSLQYGADLSVVRSANGTLTHIVYGSRAFRKER